MRTSCIDCEFFYSCKIAQDRGMPEFEKNIGGYRFSALKDLCVA